MTGKPNGWFAPEIQPEEGADVLGIWPHRAGAYLPMRAMFVSGVWVLGQGSYDEAPVTWCYFPRLPQLKPITRHNLIA